MSFIVIIPARFGSTRLPGKPLADVAGRPLIGHVVDRANESKASRVIVATDDSRIADALVEAPCEICMTRDDHLSGSDRLAEVVVKLAIEDQQLIVNVQGDEPAIPPQLIDLVGGSLVNSPEAEMATAAKQVSSMVDLENPNVVKVVFDQRGRALYFSRAAIPHNRDGELVQAWHHIGIYAYRAGFLRNYVNLKPSVLEQAESLEQLRVMDNGYSIMVETIDYEAGVGVDTAEDLELARKLLS